MPSHIAIPVTDIERSKRFYALLGFKQYNHWERPEEHRRGVWLRNTEGSRIELIEHPDNNTVVLPESPITFHFGLSVENIERTLEELRSAGVEVAVPVTLGITVKQFAFIRDPDGFPIELCEER